MINLFIGYDYVESEAYHTFVHSVMERTSQPVRIVPIMRRTLPLTRPRHPLQSNEFAFTRWLVPYLSDYEGWSLFVDCDFLCRWDIADLWHLRDPSKAVMVCQHKWEGEEGEKFLGARQTAYGRKCWSSLILFNNEKCKKLTPEFIDKADGLFLHQFQWLKDKDIGEIAVEWNWLVDVYPHNPGARMVHFTKGGPYFEDYADAGYADEWWAMRGKAMYTKQRA